jgi:predicted small secreted protein
VCRRGPEKMIRKVLLLIALTGVVLSVVGCKTVQGIGGDITWLGKKGQETIER